MSSSQNKGKEPENPVVESDTKKKGKKGKVQKAKPEKSLVGQPASQEEIKKMMALQGIKIDDGKPKSHEFWDTQPVPRVTDKDEVKKEEIGSIHKEKTPEQILDQPLDLPEGFEWQELDINDDAVLTEIYDLLEGHYVEDDDAMFRFQYTKDLLLWALKPPGWKPQWHVGIRVNGVGMLVGFITAIPATIRVIDKNEEMVEVNFLCVHKKLRSKRLTPIMIKEITRRVNRENIWYALYTAGAELPRPVTECRYYHRSLNPQKLVDVQFSGIGPRMNMKRMKHLYRVNEATKTAGLREMEEKDIPAIGPLLRAEMEKYKLSPMLDNETWGYLLMPRKDVIYSYVVEDADGKVTDLVSFYCLPSTVIGHSKHKVIKAAYLYYVAAHKTDIKALMEDVLCIAKQNDFDVFNCLDLARNMDFIADLKFGVGDGKLRYYLYNYRMSVIKPEENGSVLV